MMLIQKPITVSGRVLDWHGVVDVLADPFTGVAHVKVGSWLTVASADSGDRPEVTTDLDIHFQSWQESFLYSMPHILSTMEPWLGGVVVDSVAPPSAVVPPVNQPPENPITDPVFEVGVMP
jgi:hypothetical protein